MASSLLSLTGGSCVGCRLPGSVLCGGCRSDLRDAGAVEVAGLERVSACWKHEGAARRLVLGLKLGGRRVYADPLVDGLVGVIRRRGTEASVIAWPPCTRASERRRGFDHAEVLARGAAHRLGLPARPLLRRAGQTCDQAGLSGDERRRNLVAAFVGSSAAGSVLLVDDVVTTGATFAACAAALRRGGTERIEAIAACSAFS